MRRAIRFLAKMPCSVWRVGGICFLPLVSLTLESVLKGFSHYVQSVMPGGIVIALATYWIFDLGVIISLFACIFKFLPDAKSSGATCGWALLSRRFSLPSANGRWAYISELTAGLLGKNRACGPFYAPRSLSGVEAKTRGVP